MATKSIKPDPADGIALPADDQATATAEDVSMSATPNPAPAEITLDEFTQKLSMRDARIELVNAFYFATKKDGVIKSSESGFQERFAAFKNQVIED